MNFLQRRSRLFLLLPFLGLLLLILLFLNKIAFSNLILARGDSFLYFYPYWHAAADALRVGRIPFWNPAIFMGAPLLANSQAGFFYPLNWPVWFLLDTPYAMSASIIIHLFIAGSGAYLAGRCVMQLDRSAAFLTSLLFALGGYLTAQVEHINQLQGMAWLPWFLLMVGRGRPSSRRDWLKTVVAVAFLFSLQLLAGHTQTTFITGVAILIWILAKEVEQALVGAQRSWPFRRQLYQMLVALSVVIAAGMLALILAAVQLLPTLELTGLSSRQGGLPVNEVLSFSLNPLLLTRSLFPAYGQSLFSEYVAFLPLVVLALACIAAWQWRRRTGVLPALVWILAAFLLAFGAFNPLNWILAQLPGFNLFRVPARWLILYAFGIALLAGTGWQILLDLFHAGRTSADHEQDRINLKNTLFKPLLLFLILFLLIGIWGYLAGWLVNFLPTGQEAPFERPSLQTAAGWLIELLLLFFIIMLFVRRRQGRPTTLVFGFLLALVIMVLFVSTRMLPYNNLTTPEAFFDLRPSTTRLLANTALPSGRFISLSDIFFDPGDQAEIDTIYQDQLSPAAQYDYTIAIKQKEIIAPNLPMIYGLASIDGFDGGVLPLQSYTEQMRLILPEGVTTTDGRLRENLAAVPEARWLDLFNTQFLITDKVGDIWHDGVFFDRQHPLRLEAGQEVAVGYLPDFEATELQLLASEKPAFIQVVTAAGQSWQIEPELVEQERYRAEFPEPAVAQEIAVAACQDTGTCDLLALTLVDQRDSSFQPLVPGAYRMIHSGDVKIYENLDVMPRAYWVNDWRWIQESQAAYDAMRSPDFDINKSAILLAQDAPLPQPDQPALPSASANIKITQYLPEKVIMTTTTPQDGMLILSDTDYPGWIARVDGQPTPIYKANQLFRALFLPAGTHEITYTFEPRSYEVGLFVSLAGLLIVTIILIGLSRSRKNQKA